MDKERVVITGLGVVAPNGIGKSNFKEAIINGVSGVEHMDELKNLNFGCQIASIPKIEAKYKEDFTNKYKLKKIISSGILFGCMAGTEAWVDAGLTINEGGNPDWESGCVFGTGISGIEAIDFSDKTVDNGNPRKMGGRIAQQAMNSGISAYLGGIIGLGNQVTTNSSACTTGAEAIVMGYDRIRFGLAERMLVGSTESQGANVWAPFDAMLALNRKDNDTPKTASKPMSKHSSGFVPGAGAGALVLESLSAAKKRGARVYCEITGANVNSGGQRENGTMTIGNISGIEKCINDALTMSDISANQVDLISGHLTSTIGDRIEIGCWSSVLKRDKSDFPWVNSLKSMIGHCLSAAGSIESVSAVLQLYHGFIHPSLNCQVVHPDIESKINESKIPSEVVFDNKLNVVAKTSFGFGDVNACIIFRKIPPDINGRRRK